jgi:hypothetical protein
MRSEVDVVSRPHFHASAADRPYGGVDMDKTWLPWSAASLASGSVMMVLGSLMMPSDGSFAELIATVQGEGGRWVMASFAFFLAAVGLTLGLPALLTLLNTRGRRTGLIGIGVWTIGTIGVAGYAALLILFRAVVTNVELSAEDVEALSKDATLLAFVAIFASAFYLGEVLTAVALLRARTVPKWIAMLLLAHAGLQLVTGVMPEILQDVQTLVLGVALMGVAVHANDTWSQSG